MIRAHKKVNDSIVHLGSEAVVNTFYGLMKLYNKQNEYHDLELTKGAMWSLSGYEGKYNSIKLNELVRELTQTKTFDVSNLDIEGIKSVSGSIFVIEIYREDKIKIYVPRPYQKLLFYKKDIDIMYKAKHREPMEVTELDYWDNSLKGKKKFLVLLNEADLLNIKGKYNKRLYALLKQWDYLGRYERDWGEFKDILEIPKSYKVSSINTNILEKAKKELLKSNIKITKIEKIKKGRSIDKIIIEFKTSSLSNGKEEVLNENISMEKNIPKLEIKKNKIIKNISLKLMRKEINEDDYYTIANELNMIMSDVDLKKIMKKNNIKI